MAKNAKYIEDNFEAKRLCDAYLAGDRTAAQQLLNGVDGYLWKIAWKYGDRYRRIGIELEDFYQIFCILVLKAAQTYDPEKGKWVTYATGVLRLRAYEEIRRQLNIAKYEQQDTSETGPAMRGGMRPAKSPFDVVDASIDAETILKCIRPKERETLGKMYGTGGHTEEFQYEEAARVGVSRQAVSEQRRRVMMRIRKRIRAKFPQHSG